jgi:hypothetical protein
MGAARRHSRTPLGLTQDEAKLMVEAAESDMAIRDAVEVFTGREWTTLTAGEKVNALLTNDAVARAAGAIAGALRGKRDLRSEVDLARFGISTADRAQLLETQVAELRTKLERVAEENQALRSENVAIKAADAMAVHSGREAA